LARASAEKKAKQRRDAGRTKEDDMIQVRLSRTNLEVSKDAFGALPLQRATVDEAVRILRKAHDAGINFFDTARVYTDSEEKIAAALSARRREFILATKTQARNAADMKKDLAASLGKLKSDYIDIYQFHNPGFIPRPGDDSGLYDAALEARAQGKIRFIGITNHKLSLAKEAVESGLYDTLQFPFSYLSTEDEIELTRLCAKKDVGFIAMKALSGGLLTDIFTAQAWMTQYANVAPIWGIQRESELDELLEAIEHPAGLTPERMARVEKDRSELSGDFCRGCGYCLPCPAEIPINMTARLSFFLKRSPIAAYIGPEWQSTMARIDNCEHCGQCASRCPYGLDPPALNEKNYRWYKEFLAKL